MMAIVVNGDACKPEDVERAFAAIDGVDAVVSTIGGTTADPAADSQASSSFMNFNTFTACRSHTTAEGSPSRSRPNQLCPCMHFSCSQPLQGNINLIEAAVKHGVKKFVLVTSIGTGSTGRVVPGHCMLSTLPTLICELHG